MRRGKPARDLRHDCDLINGQREGLWPGISTRPETSSPTDRGRDSRLGHSVPVGLLAWSVGVRPELLAYSALAVVGVLLAAIDVLEQRLPTKLLMPVYPIIAALLALAGRRTQRYGDPPFSHWNDLFTCLLPDHRPPRSRLPAHWARPTSDLLGYWDWPSAGRAGSRLSATLCLACCTAASRAPS